MDTILNIYKPVGLTPFQLIEQLRASDDKFQGVKIGYAGRLDPLAHGVMLLTVGDANFRRQDFLHLNKTYHIKILLGVETDSYDALGLITSTNLVTKPTNVEAEIQSFISSRIGTFDQPYPPFSSKPINGIPLYKLAKKGSLDHLEIPTKNVEIFAIKLLDIQNISISELQNRIIKQLRQVKGHFRQTKTIKLWQDFFKQNDQSEMIEITLEIDCSSGTYMRSLAYNLGKKLGTGAIASEIFRTKVGNFELKDSYRIT